MTGLVDEFTLITLSVFLLIWVHLGNNHHSFFLSHCSKLGSFVTDANESASFCDRLHGVCKENPLAAVIGRLGLPLYRTSGDNSVLYDHDLERCVILKISRYNY